MPEKPKPTRCRRAATGRAHALMRKVRTCGAASSLRRAAHGLVMKEHAHGMEVIAAMVEKLD